ncbi:hypothetical protein MMC17_005197 [Xylographa soralifera]|nr:hypothetical protein [Xylographa soralifera]
MASEKGYPQLSTILGNFEEMAMFRKFTRLNFANLAYMQAEILILETELDVIGEMNEQGGNWMQESVEELRKHPESPQWAKIKEIRSKLKEYSKSTKLKHADRTTLELLGTWIRGKDASSAFLHGDGLEPRAWTNDANDVIVLSARGTHSDSFTNWLANSAIPRLFDIGDYGKRLTVMGAEEMGLRYLEPTKIAAYARIISTSIASILPTCTVVVLYFIHSLIARIGAVVAFSALFAVSVAFFTNARPVEVFSATAALAAVQVVFIGSTTP